MTTEQWLKFASAAKAQAAIDDALAYALAPEPVPENWGPLDAQCRVICGQSLPRYYNTCRQAGRAAFLVEVANHATSSAGLASWFGDKVLKIEQGSSPTEPVQIVIDV